MDVASHSNQSAPLKRKSYRVISLDAETMPIFPQYAHFPWKRAATFSSNPHDETG